MRNKFTLLLLAGVAAIGCATESEPGSVVDANSPDAATLSAQLRDSNWLFAYYTAALGGDRKHWLVFGGEDAFTRIDWAWVYDGDGHTYPTNHWVGSYEVQEGREVSVRWSEGTVEYEQSFLAAVLEEAPRLYGRDPTTLPTRGRSLTTRAYVPIGPDRWQTRFGSGATGANTVTSSWSRSTVTIARDGEECSLTVVVEV